MVSRGGRSNAVSGPDGTGPLVGDPIRGDARVFDSANASFQELLLDVLERIQQQLGQINNNNNLEPGERF